MEAGVTIPLDGRGRFAIYWAPARDGALHRLGSAWLGRDAESGEPVAAPELRGLPGSRETLVVAASRYGLHATLKPPFRLMTGVDPAALDAAARTLAAGIRRFRMAPLEVRSIGGCVCLGFSRPCPEMDALAASCVRGLDMSRAPASPEEMTRRRGEGLDPVEEKNLLDWGYPYVLERFRFHMTLSGGLPPPERAALSAVLEAYFKDALRAPVEATEITLFGEPAGGGDFRLLRRYPLVG